MKVIEIINEDASEKELINIARTIMRDCGPYLQQIDNKPLSYGLFRGIDISDFFTKTTCPKNREPRDSDIGAHKIADEWFFKNTGIRFRSNAIFATGDMQSADEYGDTYRIFPIGNFTICWSPLAKDMTNEVFANCEEDDFNTKRQWKAALFNDLAALNYQTTDVKEAIISDNEIMINCNMAYLLRIDEDDWQDIEILKYIEQFEGDHPPERPASQIPANSARITSLAHQIYELQKAIKRKAEIIKQFEDRRKTFPPGTDYNEYEINNYEFFVQCQAKEEKELAAKQSELSRLTQ